jgi:hypothetical protein
LPAQTGIPDTFGVGILIPFDASAEPFFKVKPMTAAIVDVDEALTHLNQVPADERGAAWQAYLNAVLDQRLKTKD